MFILIPLIILAIGLAFVPNHIHGFGTTKVKIPAWIIIAILIGSTFFMIVDPGEVVRVYQFGGGERTPHAGLEHGDALGQEGDMGCHGEIVRFRGGRRPGQSGPE